MKQLPGYITWNEPTVDNESGLRPNLSHSSVRLLSLQKESHVWSGDCFSWGGKGMLQSFLTQTGIMFEKIWNSASSKTHTAPIALGRDSLRNVSLEKRSIWWCVPALQGPRHCLTSVWRMAALCSLAVSDSLSTSMCCLQSEFWLLRVSSFVCKARSSDSFLESSCFSWSIWKTRQLQNLRKFSSNSLYLTTTHFSLFSIGGNYGTSRKCHESAYRNGPGLEEVLLRQKIGGCLPPHWDPGSVYHESILPKPTCLRNPEVYC